MPLRELISGTTVAKHRPYPRVVVDAVGWRDVSERLAAGDLTLLGLWGDAGMVHMAVLDESPGDIGVARRTPVARSRVLGKNASPRADIGWRKCTRHFDFDV
jgi:hypothetical protein